MLGSLGFTLEITQWTSLDKAPQSPAEVLKSRGQPSLRETWLQPREHLLHQPGTRRGVKTTQGLTSVSPVGDAGAAALCQLEGVFQLLNGIGVPPTTGPVLASQLKKRKVVKRVLAERERHLLHHKLNICPITSWG